MSTSIYINPPSWLESPNNTEEYLVLDENATMQDVNLFSLGLFIYNDIPFSEDSKISIQNLYRNLSDPDGVVYAEGCMVMIFQELLREMPRTSIMMDIDAVFDGKTSIGASKIGGKPDLPLDFEWPYYKGEHFDGSGISNRPLSFIAQINCEDASKYDGDTLLPKEGVLYFFYELASSRWGFDPNDKGCAKVYYYAGDMLKLIRTELPEDLLTVPYNFHVPEAPISFSATKELPCFEEFIQLCGEDISYDHWDEYDNAKAELGYKIDETDNFGKSKLLGYADLVQGGMLLECELSYKGIYCGGAEIKIAEEEMRQYKKNCNQWKLLFQLGSLNIGDYELMWGDMGRIYYYIKIDDLKKLDFENCWLVLQCG